MALAKKKDGGLASSRRAMMMSLWVGFFMLGTKVYAYVLTGSAAVLSDAAESVVHVLAVCFAAYSLYVSYRPPDPSHPYGHDKIVFLSAGFEGAAILVAAGYIVYEAIRKWIFGFELERLGEGIVLIVVAAGLNGVLGWYLTRVGKRERSLILEANGKHVLTDCWTSVGVVVGLGLVSLTEWKFLDPLIALLVAFNIIISGSQLVRRSVRGLLDEAEPETVKALQEILRGQAEPVGVKYHGLRHRHSGRTLWVEFHLLFPMGTLLEDAHRLATQVEEKIQDRFPPPVEVISHLEPLEDHASVHQRGHFENFQEES